MKKVLYRSNTDVTTPWFLFFKLIWVPIDFLYKLLRVPLARKRRKKLCLTNDIQHYAYSFMYFLYLRSSESICLALNYCYYPKIYMSNYLWYTFNSNISSWKMCCSMVNTNYNERLTCKAYYQLTNLINFWSIFLSAPKCIFFLSH